MAAVGNPKPWHIDMDTFLEVRAAIERGRPYATATASAREKGLVAQWYMKYPARGYDIKSVEVIYNHALQQRFEIAISLLENRHGKPAFNATFLQESRSQAEKDHRSSTLRILQNMSLPFKDPEFPHLTIVPQWHGTKREHLDSIFQTGFANLAKTDEGFYGKGIYGTGEAEYAFRVYAQGEQGALLINWVCCFSAYPVIHGDMDKLAGGAAYRNYDAHFAPVVPENPRDPQEVNYIPCRIGKKHTYTELVVFESDHVTPGFVVTLQPNFPQAPVQDVEEKVHEMNHPQFLRVWQQLQLNPNNEVAYKALCKMAAHGPLKGFLMKLPDGRVINSKQFLRELLKKKPKNLLTSHIFGGGHKSKK